MKTKIFFYFLVSVLLVNSFAIADSNDKVIKKLIKKIGSGNWDTESQKYIYNCELITLDEKFKGNKEFIVKLLNSDYVKKCPVLKDLSPELRNDKEVISLSLKKECTLSILSEELKANKKFILETINSGYRCSLLPYISSDLRDDRDVVYLAIKNIPNDFRYARDQFKDDKRLAFEVIKKDPNNYKLLSETLRADYEIVEYIAKSPNYYVLNDLPSEFRNNKPYFQNLIKIDPEIIYLGDPVSIKDDEVIVKQAIQVAKQRGIQLYSHSISERLNKIYGLPVPDGACAGKFDYCP